MAKSFQYILQNGEYDSLWWKGSNKSTEKHIEEMSKLIVVGHLQNWSIDDYYMSHSSLPITLGPPNHEKMKVLNPQDMAYNP